MPALDPRREAAQPFDAVRETLAQRPRIAAELGTIRPLKSREGCGRWLFAVSFRDRRRRAMFYLATAERAQGGGWISLAGSGGPITPPHRAEKWVHLEGWMTSGQFNAGGQLLRPREDIAEVRLQLDDGAELVSDACHGVVLFIADDIGGLPATASLYDSGGRLCARQRAF